MPEKGLSKEEFLEVQAMLDKFFKKAEEREKESHAELKELMHSYEKTCRSQAISVERRIYDRVLDPINHLDTQIQNLNATVASQGKKLIDHKNLLDSIVRLIKAGKWTLTGVGAVMGIVFAFLAPYLRIVIAIILEKGAQLK